MRVVCCVCVCVRARRRQQMKQFDQFLQKANRKKADTGDYLALLRKCVLCDSKHHKKKINIPLHPSQS